MFALITGFMEAGETPQDGIAREIKEETNLDTTALDLIGVYDFQRMNQIIIAYHAVCTGDIKLSPELEEYRLYDYDKLKCWPAGTGYALADWLRMRAAMSRRFSSGSRSRNKGRNSRGGDVPGGRAAPLKWRQPKDSHAHRQRTRHTRPELPAAHFESQESAG